MICIKEVGVDLELCVHAHGHDVDPIIEESCNNNYFLEMKSYLSREVNERLCIDEVRVDLEPL